MAAYKKVDKKLKELEDSYVQVGLTKKIKKDKSLYSQSLYDEAQTRIQKKYQKVLLKAKLNEEEANTLKVLKLKKVGLKLAKAGAAALQALELGAVTLLPALFVGAGAGAIVGFAVHEALGFVTGIFGGIAAGAGEVGLYLISEKAQNWLKRIGTRLKEKVGDADLKNEAHIRMIEEDIKKQAEQALAKAAGESDARIEQDKALVDGNQNPAPDDRYSAREEALAKLRLAAKQARQEEEGNEVLGEQPEV